jgi:hypothetical protein
MLSGAANIALPVIMQEYYAMEGLLTGPGLALFAKTWNEGGDVSQWYINGVPTIVENMDLTEVKDWTPIGTPERPWTGEFNGNGKKLINFKSSKPLFGVVENATLKNIIFDETSTISLTGEYNSELYLVPLAAEIKSTTVENCTNYGNVVCENGHGAKLSAVSGITGFGGGSTVNCANYGDVTLANATGLYAATAFAGVFGNTEQSHTGITLNGKVTSNLDIALLVAGQSNNAKTVTLGTAAAPIVIDEVSLNGVAVTAENLATTTMAVNTEEANVANLVYEVGTTVVMKGESSAPALSVDGKRWQLPADICEMVFGAPNAVLVADLGVSTPGQLMVLADYESIYGPQAAGMWAPMLAVAYTVEPTDATSGNVVLMQTDMFGDVNKTNLPYSNLTADSVVIDFTGMLGMPGSGPCTLYTGEVNLNGGGVAM